MKFTLCLALIISMSHPAVAGPGQLIKVSQEFVGLFAGEFPEDTTEIEGRKEQRLARRVGWIDIYQKLLHINWTQGRRWQARGNAEGIEECRVTSLGHLAKLEQGIDDVLVALDGTKLQISHEAVVAAAGKLRAEVKRYREELTPERFPEEEKAPNKPVEPTSGTRTGDREIRHSFALAVSAAHG